MKVIPTENLIIRESFSIFYGGGELWVEQLDSLSIHKDIVIDKFMKDMVKISKPSAPSLIAINLNQTSFDEEIAETIVTNLLYIREKIKKVVFVGLNFKGRYLINKKLRKQLSFKVATINDFEKAKEWLMI